MFDDRIFIAISGKQRRGKDTVCDILLKSLPSYERVSVSDLIITEVSYLYKIPIAELTRLKNIDGGVRGMIIQHGWDMRQKHGDDYWIKQITDTKGDVIMPSLRLVDEVLHIKSCEPFNVLVRVDCNEDIARQRGVLSNIEDRTETELDAYDEWDFVIHNNSDIESLQEQCEPIIRYVTALKTDLRVGV